MTASPTTYALDGTCLFCKKSGVMRVYSKKRHLDGMTFRQHECPNCLRRMVSVQMLIDPLKMLEMGISPLLSSVVTRKRKGTPAAGAGVIAG